MTDTERRRIALQLAAQLPKDPKDRRQIVEYLGDLLPWLDGQDDGRSIERRLA